MKLGTTLDLSKYVGDSEKTARNQIHVAAEERNHLQDLANTRRTVQRTPTCNSTEVFGRHVFAYVYASQA